MRYEDIWRVIGLFPTALYAIFAFQAGLAHRTLTLGLNCFIAALYFFSVAKSHSLVKAKRRRRRFD